MNNINGGKNNTRSGNTLSCKYYVTTNAYFKKIRTIECSPEPEQRVLKSFAEHLLKICDIFVQASAI